MTFLESILKKKKKNDGRVFFFFGYCYSVGKTYKKTKRPGILKIIKKNTETYVVCVEKQYAIDEMSNSTINREKRIEKMSIAKQQRGQKLI